MEIQQVQGFTGVYTNRKHINVREVENGFIVSDDKGREYITDAEGVSELVRSIVNEPKPDIDCDLRDSK